MVESLLRRTRDGDQDDLLVCPFLGGIVVQGDTAGVDAFLVFRPWDGTIEKGLVSRVQAIAFTSHFIRVICNLDRIRVALIDQMAVLKNQRKVG